MFQTEEAVRKPFKIWVERPPKKNHLGAAELLCQEPSKPRHRPRPSRESADEPNSFDHSVPRGIVPSEAGQNRSPITFFEPPKNRGGPAP